ncbi:MAG: lysophospholipid acyltransferase family protein [Blastocatellia bacterium]
MQSDIGSATDGSLVQDTKSETAQVAEAPKSMTRAERSMWRNAANSRADQLRQRVYGLDDLSAYTARDRLIIRAADLCFYFLIGVICSSLRWEVRGYEHLDSIVGSGKRAIFTFWHSCILSATWFWRKRGIVVMSSVSRDAEYTGRVIKRFGYGTARGSSTRKGGRALAEMAQCLDNGMDAAFTIDGPRGPAYQAKPGAVTLARHTGQGILPFHIATRRHVELPSWDRLKVPLPFSRALTLIAEPIYVPREATGEQIATAQADLQSALDKLRSEGEAWRTKR